MTKRRRVKKGGFRIVHLLLILLLIYTAWSLHTQSKLKRELETKRQSAKADIKVLEEDIEFLNDQISKSGTLEFIERVARDELGMVKPREIIYIDKSNQKTSFFEKLKNDN